MIQVLQLLFNQKNLELTRLDHKRERIEMDMAHVRLAIQEYTSLLAAHKAATATKTETKTERNGGFGSTGA